MPVDTDALYAASPQLAALRDDVALHYSSISYVDSDDDSWGSDQTSAGIIFTADDEHPDSGLAHELLHLWLQSRGYRRIRSGSSSFDETPWLGHFIGALDNELQHHRMFLRYMKMGLDPQWFYGSSEQFVADELNAALDDPARDIKSTVLKYLTCIAPGGRLAADQMMQFKQRFHEDRGGEFHERLAAIDKAFEAWRRATHTLNAEPYIRYIMLALENPSDTWFGYGKSAGFPENGFFVGPAPQNE